jgi:hypothetical protein
MIISRFFRTANLVLESEYDCGRVGNQHAQLFMSLCLISCFFPFCRYRLVFFFTKAQREKTSRYWWKGQNGGRRRVAGRE